MPFFKDAAVEKKYTNTGDSDPVVHVTIMYAGPLSGAPMPIADKMYADGAHIALKKDQDKDIEKIKPVKEPA